LRVLAVDATKPTTAAEIVDGLLKYHYNEP